MTRRRWLIETVERRPGAIGAVLALVGTFVGYGVVTWRTDGTPESRLFAATPQFRVWAFILAGLMGYWGVVSPRLWSWMIRTRREYTATRRPRVSGVLLYAVALVGIAFLSRDTSGQTLLVWHEVRLVIFLVAGALAMAPAVMGMQEVERAARQAFWESTSLPDAVSSINRLQTRLRGFLSIYGGSLGLVVFATGALFNALDAHLKVGPPAELVLIYGAAFAALIAAFYLPASSAVQKHASAILDAFAPIASEADASFASKYDTRKKLSEALGLEPSPREDLEKGLFVLSPLISGFISFFLPGPD